MLMGGRKSESLFNDGAVGKVVQKIADKDLERAKVVSAFYFDMRSSIERVAGAVKPGGYVVYVVGNRTVRGNVLPTDVFIAEEFSRNGFEHEITFRRKIHRKSMPFRNAYSDNMSCEYIVVCRKKNGGFSSF
jgi:hypothetical protein